MAFPFLFHENFEAGTKGGFTTEVDPDGKIDFPNRLEGLDIPPWRGGYVMQIGLDRSANPAYVQHDTVFSMTAGQTRYMRFFIRLSADFKMPPGGAIDFMRIYSGPSGVFEVSEVAFAILRTDSWYSLGIGSAEDVAHISGVEILRDEWTQVRVKITHGTGNGRVQLSVGHNTVQNMRVTMQPATTHFRIGALLQNVDARGTIYLDDIVIDVDDLAEQQHIDASDLAGRSIIYTKTTYAFIGPGVIRGATLIGAAANNQALFFDTDQLPYAYHNLKATLKVAAAESKDILIESIVFHKGCYIVLSGANPQVIVQYGRIAENVDMAA